MLCDQCLYGAAWTQVSACIQARILSFSDGASLKIGRFYSVKVVMRGYGSTHRGAHDGCLAEPVGLGGSLADSVPRERRRQPRADGLEHAASSRAYITC